MTHINAVCDDVLLEIFSYLKTDHLICSVSDVCVRWKNIIENESWLWFNRWYEWDLSDSSTTLRHNLSKVPCLKGLILKCSNYEVFDKNMKEMRYLNQINSIELVCKVNINVLHFLNPCLVYFSALDICHQDYNCLKDLKNLETLKLGNAYDFCGRHLRLIADYCTKLKKFYLGTCRSLITYDVLYFIEKKKQDIEVLEINGYGLTEEVFISFLQCNNLKELKIHNAKRVTETTLGALVRLPNLKVLHMHQLGFKSFQFMSVSDTEGKHISFGT